MKTIELDIKEEQEYLDSFGVCLEVFEDWPTKESIKYERKILIQNGLKLLYKGNK